MVNCLIVNRIIRKFWNHAYDYESSHIRILEMKFWLFVDYTLPQLQLWTYSIIQIRFNVANINQI